MKKKGKTIKREDRVDEEVIEEMNQDILQKLSGNKLSLDSTSLDLSDTRFQLINLNGLTQSRILQLEKLIEIDISSNRLKSIDIVQNFRSLQRVNASKNQVVTLDIDLPKLKELDMSYNKLQFIPTLLKLPRLENLFLQGNMIQNIGKEILAVRQTLDKLNLSSNKIVFAKGKIMQQFIDNLKTMNALKVLNIDKNPFCDDYPRYKDFFIKDLCPDLEQLNNQVIPPQQIKEIKQDPNFPVLSEIVVQMQQKQTQKQVRQDTINLQQAIMYLEKCRNNPQMCIDVIQDLSFEINKIVNSPGNWDDIFTHKDPIFQAQIDDQIDDFLQNCFLLVENQRQISKSVMQIMANMSIIDQGNMGLKCVKELNNIMQAGIELKGQVLDVLRENVIPLTQQEEINDIPTPILTGLKYIIENNSQDSQLFSLFDQQMINYMSQWMKAIKQHIQKPDEEEEANKQAINNIHDCNMNLIAAASSDINNANLMRNTNILMDAQEIMKSAIVNNSSDRYISLLEILKNIFINDISASQQARQSKESPGGFYNLILKEFKKFTREFKKNDAYDLRDVIAKDSDEVLKIKYKKFGQIIETFGAIYVHHQFNLDEIKNDEVTNECLGFITIYKLNPQLIISCSILMNSLLKNEHVNQSYDMIRHIVNQCQKLQALVPYLGGKKYSVICELSEMYYANTFFNNDGVKLANNNNKIMHKMFISILDLLGFFIMNSNKVSTIQDISREVIQSQQNKEQLLFKILEVNSNEVKVAVINCLLAIAPEEWNADQLEQLVGLVETNQNLGFGNTETILSCIFMIFIRIIKQPQLQVTKDFLSRSSGRINTACLDILEKNQARDLLQYKAENYEKMKLSLSCVYFLKAVSENLQARNNFSAKQCRQCIQSSLKNEELYMEETFVPIDIERTHLGKNLEYLIGFTIGENAIDAYHIVAYRILSQVADLLEGRYEEPIPNFNSDKFNVDIIRDHVRNKIKKRIVEEFEIWEPTSDVNLKESENFKGNVAEWENFQHQHTLFSKYEGIEKLLFYLLGKTANTQAQILSNRLTKEFNPKYRNLELKDGMSMLTNRFEREETKRQQYMKKKQDAGKLGERPPAKEPLGEQEGKNKLQMSFQEQEVIAKIDPKVIDKVILQAPIMNQIQKNKNDDKSDNKQKNDEFNINDQQLVQLGQLNYEENYDQVIRKRCLLVSTMLRAFRNSIEFSPIADTRKHAVEQLKRRATIKMLTQLCGTTGWIVGNIGIKYLKIIFYGLKLSNRLNQEEKENTEAYELISYAMMEMMTLLRINVLQQDKNKLSTEDKTLLYNLSEGCQLMAQQTPSIVWSLMDAKAFTHSQKSMLLTPQERTVGMLLSKIFPKEDIKVFVDDLVHEMRTLKDRDQNDFKENPDLKKEYTFNKKTRTNLIKFFGAYLSNCKHQRFEIMEYFISPEVIERKDVRQSYIQEILREMTRQSYKTHYQKYILKKKLGHKAGVLERVIEMFDVLVCCQGENIFYTRHLIMTDRLMYIFVQPESKCTCCPNEFFCPETPILEFKLEYRHIQYVSKFEGCQRIAIKCSNMIKLTKGFQDNFYSKNYSELFLILFFPKFDQSKLFLDVVSSYSEIYFQEDMIFNQGLKFILKKYDFCAWVLLNPSQRIIAKIERGDRNLEYANKKVLLLIQDKTIFFIYDQLQKWFFYDIRNLDALEREKGIHDEMNMKNLTDEEKKEQAQRDLWIRELEKRKLDQEEAIKSIFSKYSEYEINNLSYINFDTGLVSFIDIEFGTFNFLKIVFFCDTARQDFREHLHSVMNFKKFKKYQPPKD